MKIILFFYAIVFGFKTSTCFPYGIQYRPVRMNVPRRTYMLEGFYGGHQINRRSDYVPQGAMTAFATGDMVATGNYWGDHSSNGFEQPNEEVLKKFAQDQTDVVSTEATIEEATFAEVEPTPPPKKKSKKLPQKPIKDEDNEEEEEDEDDGYWPFQNAGRSYNAFFPIMFGYPNPKSRSSESNGGYPGAATAIANSFSTGKGGVASSHATAFGDPSLSSLFKNGKFNFKRKNGDKE